MDAREVKVLDKNSAFYGVIEEKLMENAGRGVAEIIEERYDCKKCIIFCGTGNNGGDGFVAARYLSKKCDVKIILLGDIKSPLALKNFRRAKRLGISIYRFNEKVVEECLEESDIIVDAMLGVGISGELREPYSTAVKKINNAGKPIVSVDIPTGIGGKIFVEPSLTVTFHDIKDGMNTENSGEIVVKGIGIPKEAETFIGPGEMVYYPLPKKDSHKGENGVVVTIGGGPYTGAPFLSAMASLVAGADLSFLFVPKLIWNVVASFSPNLIVKPIEGEFLCEEHLPLIKNFIEKADSIVIGPGIGNREETKKACWKVVEESIFLGKKVVVDADAISCLQSRNCRGNVVITPHAGEFKELTGISLPKDMDERKDIVMKEAKKLHATILLKGSIDVITDGNVVKLNKIHNQAMTVGGTGDVLSGICGAMLSKGVKPYDAARIAAFINGMAGNYAFEKKGYGMVATDLLQEIPEVLKNFLPNK